MHERQVEELALLRRQHGLVAAFDRQLGKRLRSAGFESILSRGYAIVRDADGIVITGREAVTKGRKLRLKFVDGEADATGG